MNEQENNKIKDYSKKTPLYLSRRKFDQEGKLTEVICSSCKTFKPLSEFAKNKKEIDGIEHKCKACKSRK
jgi:hypothetical protein